MEVFGKRLREACELQNMTARQLKAQLHMGSIQAIYLWLEGKRLPNLDNLYALSKCLGVSMEELLEERNEKPETLKQTEMTDYGDRVLSYWAHLR